MKDLTYLNKNRITIYGQGWDHVSISSEYKIPSWKVMCIVKEMFFENDEAVMQMHPAKRNYINTHPNCLHLWKPQKQEIPQPPKYMV